MWIVRNKGGKLSIYTGHIIPSVIRDAGDGWYGSMRDDGTFITLITDLFPEVTYESGPKWVRFYKKEWVPYQY